MNESIDRSLILPDEYKHVVSPLQAKVSRAKKVIAVLAVLSVVLLTLTIYFAASPTVSADVADENRNLKELSAQLRERNSQLLQDLAAKKDLSTRLVSKQASLQSQLQQNNDQIVLLESDIKLNCDPVRQRLRFNMTNMNAFTLSVQDAGGSDGSDVKPAVTFLNVSGNQLATFSDNALPSLEYLDLTNNPLARVSSNRLDRVTEIVGISPQPLLKEFSSNFLPLVKSLNFSGNKISIFKDNVITALEILDVAGNSLTAFSNFTLGSLRCLNISSNPIAEFNLNTFQNLMEFTSSFPKNTAVQFNGNYFGKLNALMLNSEEGLSQPLLTFSNNYFPVVTNLTLRNFKYNYESLKTNRMPVLTHLKFDTCDFSNIAQYIQYFPSIVSLEFYRTSFKKFTGLSYPNLARLVMNYVQISQFSNNSLPSLRQLVIYRIYPTPIWGNAMPNLRTLSLSSSYINETNFLKQLHYLQELTLSSIFNLAAFENYSFPELRKLNLSYNDQVQSYRNNSLPALTSLKIECQNCTVQLAPFQNQLQYLSLFLPSKEFANHNFPRLKYLNVESSKKGIHFANNNLPVLEELQLYMVDSLQSSNLPSLRSLALYAPKTPTLTHRFDQTLEFLKIWSYADDQCMIKSLDSYSLPKLKQLTILTIAFSSFTKNALPSATRIQIKGALTTFDCSGLTALQELILSGNKLTDSIVDTLINCKLSGLSFLDLGKNNIMDTVNSKVRLSLAYPNTAIVM